MTDMPDNAPNGYITQLDSLRSTAKWLVTAFAAVAVLLVGGLQLSRIGALSPSSWRLWACIGSVSIALTTVGYMINAASIVLTHEWLTLATFSDDPDDGVLRLSNRAIRRAARRAALLQRVEEGLEASQHELFGYAAATISQLHARLCDCDERIWKETPGSDAASKAQQEAATLRQAAREAVQYANYYFTLELFKKMRIRLGWAAGVVAVSVGVFAYAATPPAHSSPSAVRASKTKDALWYTGCADHPLFYMHYEAAGSRLIDSPLSARQRTVSYEVAKNI